MSKQEFPLYTQNKGKALSRLKHLNTSLFCAESLCGKGFEASEVCDMFLKNKKKMENKINYKDVPGCFLHCIQSDCQMANHCLRQLAMQALPDSERAVTILNPQLTKAAEKCEFYRSDEPQVYGKGFMNMQTKMLPGQYDTFRYRLQGKFGRNPYFERRKGERLCSPSEIKEVEAALKAIGHEELKFDAYVEKLNWID